MGRSVSEQRLEPASSATAPAEPVWPPLAKRAELGSKECVFQGDYLALSGLSPR